MFGQQTTDLVKLQDGGPAEKFLQVQYQQIRQDWVSLSVLRASPGLPQGQDSFRPQPRQVFQQTAGYQADEVR